MAALFLAARPGELARHRRALGLSLRDLEDLSGVSRSTLSVIERSPADGVEAGKAFTIATALRAHPGRLFMHKNGDPVAWEVLP